MCWQVMKPCYCGFKREQSREQEQRRVDTEGGERERGDQPEVRKYEGRRQKRDTPSSLESP